jgi:dTDP-4-amino-4,6-dideoxygalactose transaminase
MTTGGEGGMVTCNDKSLWSRMWSFKDHGKSWDAVYNYKHDPGFRWLHESIGTNWRMLEMQATIGRLQLRNMSDWTARRTEIASSLCETLSEFGAAVRVPKSAGDIVHAHYRQYAYIRPDGLKHGWSRDRIVKACTDGGAPVFQGSCSEVYLEKAFDKTPWRPAYRLPVARELGETSLMFLTHPTISDAQCDRYCQTIRSVFAEASK